MPVRVIAFYLPQFHPVPENDAWWGKGFTEWTNVARARPLFPGHYQPHLPADLGFYDLRVPETRAAQAQMARTHGVSAFCYYHYWFAGRRILERPFSEVLASGEPDFPFCLCWANQSWTGIWHGTPDRILIEQTYPGRDDHVAHFNALLPAFRDPRYLRVDGKPLFCIFESARLPTPRQTLDLWRTLARDAGLPGLHLVGCSHAGKLDADETGVDAIVNTLLRPRRNRRPPGTLMKYDYCEAVRHLVLPPRPGVTTYPCVIPNWDNTPRTGRQGLVLHDWKPECFARHLRHALEALAGNGPEDQIVFVKSWNEWAEGNHLEPDQRHGLACLQTLRDTLAAQTPDLSRPHVPAGGGADPCMN